MERGRKKGHKGHDGLHSQSTPESDRLNKDIPDKRVCYLQSSILPAYLIPHMPDLTAGTQIEARTIEGIETVKVCSACKDRVNFAGSTRMSHKCLKCDRTDTGGTIFDS